jgi:3-deoxy-manno-octulosonate cytidylyltransferase (CMP-KDO synthetase)
MSSSADCRFRVAIPARYGSTRLKGKPLRLIAGKTMIRRVYDNAVESGAESVVVATDDSRILQEVKGFGGRAVMTAAGHASGTDRIAEVVEKERWPENEIVVNLQGDEPGIGADLIRSVAVALNACPAAGIATLATPIRDAQEIFDPNAVKVVVDRAGMALYFSRAPIPWVRDLFGQTPGRLADPPAGVPFLRHLGLYCYRVGSLLRLAGHQPAGCERAEALEQLRALWLGIGIHVSVVDSPPARGIDSEEDLRQAQERFGKPGQT